MKSFKNPYFWNCVFVERGVPDCHVGYVQGQDVSHPLDLMNDRISVGHVLSVFYCGLSGLTNHGVNLSLDFLCNK